MLPSRCTLARRLALATCALVLTQLAGLAPPPAGAEISGSTYTSPQYDFTVTWDDTWFVNGEESTPYYDVVHLTNGLTYASIYGEPDTYPTIEGALASNISGLREDPAVDNYEPIRDETGAAIRGGDETRSFAAAAYTYTYEDGSEEELAVYIEVRALIPGELLISLWAITVPAAFDAERPLAEALLDGVRIGDEPAPGPAESVAGEPGPVFASGPWRIAVATSALAPEFADLDLKPKADKEWLLVVLDVTNWSDADAELAASHFTIALDGEVKPVKIARSSLRPVAEQLSLTPFSEDLTLAIAADETVRVALAFVLPTDGREPRLLHREAAVPIEDTLELDLAPGGLPGPAVPAEIAAGEIVSASDGRTMRIALDGEGSAERVQLLGIELPDTDDCFENAAENMLDDLAGARVLVEEDTAVTGGRLALRYVWLVEDDGTRTLLNQMLLAAGAARVDNLPGDARFGAWLEATAIAAEDAKVGLWGDCDQ